MKRCPRCNQSYSDEQLNFCLNDGEMLMQADDLRSRPYDDSPPTVILNDPRVTNPTNWQAPQPMQPWQQQSQMQPAPMFGSPTFIASRDQTLPTVSLILGIASFVLVCCYGGIWLGLPAAIVGFIALRNTDSDPTRYGGRGLAIGGMVLGVISFLASIVFALFALFAG